MRQIAEARKTIAATIHQLGGRHKYFPKTIPTEKNIAAHKSGCRAKSCFRVRADSLALPLGRATARVLNEPDGVAALANANLKRQFVEPGGKHFLCGKSGEIDRPGALQLSGIPSRLAGAGRVPA